MNRTLNKCWTCASQKKESWIEPRFWESQQLGCRIFFPLSFLFATKQKSNPEKRIATWLCLTKQANQNKITGVLSFPAQKAEAKKISFFAFAKHSPNTLAMTRPKIFEGAEIDMKDLNLSLIVGVVVAAWHRGSKLASHPPAPIEFPNLQIIIPEIFFILLAKDKLNLKLHVQKDNLCSPSD